MSKKPSRFDFWYAVNHTRVVTMPSARLETFGNTILNYHMICELMDAIDKVRVRVGRVQAFRPQIVTPKSFTDALLEGFGEEAMKYVDWLQEHRIDLRILEYGFKIKKEEFSEHILSDNIEAVTERIRKEVDEKKDPLSAVVLGVDEPWEVCLIKLMTEVIRESAPNHFEEIGKKNLFGETDGVPNVVRQEIEIAFNEAARDATKIKALAHRLERHGLFQRYEDRFFSLVRHSG